MEDRFRLMAAVGKARLNYSFYGIGNKEGKGDVSIPIGQSALALVTEWQVRVVERWFAGARFQTSKTRIGLDFDLPETEIEVPVLELDTRTAAIGLHAQRDARDSIFYPRRGSVLDLMGRFFTEEVGSNFEFQSYTVSFTDYRSMGDQAVLAYRMSACAVEGRPPFFSLCMLGNDADLRGYEAGRYRDRRMLAGQIEYRRRLPRRFGFVVFGGAGEVAATLRDFNLSNIRPGVGAGIRFTLAERSGINLRFDVAVGQDGPAWYISMGEAF
jgi:outer membrane protein assembly factor BamA